jgi:amino acid adenylation domain-containing protein
VTELATVESLLGELTRAGVRLRLVDEDRIEVSAVAGRLSPDLRQALARHKPDLLVRLREAGAGAPAAELPLIVPDRERLYEPFPASDLQQSFLIGGREGFEYHVRPHQYMEFEFDELDPERFGHALNRVLARHRDSIVVFSDDMTLRTVRDPGPVSIAVDDLRALPEAEAQARMAATREAMCRLEPRHDRWPWLEPRISLYGAGRARLHYNNNNIFTDAPSGAALITEAVRLYQHPDAPLPPLRLSYRDCVLALAELEESPLGQASKRYWCDRMADWPAAPEVPLAPGNAYRGRSMMSRRELSVPAEQWTALREQAESRGLTTTNVLLGAHAEMLAAFSGSRHFLLNNMISHRPIPLHPQMPEVLGNFASLYPLEVDWRHDEPFSARVRRLQARLISDVDHMYWSGSKVLQELNRVRRTPGRAVCPFAVGSALFVGPADRPYFSMLETPQCLLDTEFWELRDGRLLVIWDVIEPAFPPGLIDAMFDAYRSVVEDLTQSQAWDRTAFDLLPAAQRAQRAALNAVPAPPAAGLLPDPLARHAVGCPGKPAVVAATGSLDYAGLHARARGLADELIRRGVDPGDRVVVMLPKGPEQVVAVCAALMAGGAYVPVDPQWPRERLRYLCTDTKARAVLTDRGHAGLAVAVAEAAEAADAAEAAVVIVPGVAEPAPVALPASGRLPRRSPEDLAYVIYTSGSTGRPKGAMLDHRGPLATIGDVNARFGVGSGDVLFAASSLTFDLSVYDVFGTLAAGATLVMPGPDQTDPTGWPELAAAHGVTVWNSVPAIMELVVGAAEAGGVELPALRLVLLSGDWVPVGLPDRIRTIAPNARVVSLGGATEASIWSIHHPVDRVDPDWPSIPYGRPLAGQSWHVLDERGQDAPVWVPGHLYIGGVGVALGYLGDPEKTAAAFVAHPRTGERLYRTGDLGRYLPDGEIEFLGRADFQVKIQGFRVEPGEVEHALAEHPDVVRAAVVARRSGSGSGRQLTGFVVGSASGPEPEPDALRAFLAGRLPAYLVPSHLVVLDELPLTGNGKVDRAALERLEPASAGASAGPVAPRTPTERVLAEIWAEVLETDGVGVHDDFFDLGGQSFAALKAGSLVLDRLGRRVPLGTLLECRTVAALAAWLDEPGHGWSPLATLKAEGAGAPCYFVHPAGGNVLCYRGLAERLDRPFHAFQAPGPAAGREVLDDVEALAALYADALLETDPQGPYILGGWSSGAVIAFAMARVLQDRGCPAAAVVVVDAPAPVAARQIDDIELVLWFLEDLDLGFDVSAVTPAACKELAAAPGTLRLGAALELLRAQGIDDRDLDPDGLAATFAVFSGIVQGCNNYRGRRIDADLTVVRADTPVVSEFADHPAGDAADWGWAALTTGSVAATVVPGTHHTLLAAEPSLAAIAALIAGLPTESADSAGPVPVHPEQGEH